MPASYRRYRSSTPRHRSGWQLKDKNVLVVVAGVVCIFLIEERNPVEEGRLGFMPGAKTRARATRWMGGDFFGVETTHGPEGPRSSSFAVCSSSSLPNTHDRTVGGTMD